MDESRVVNQNSTRIMLKHQAPTRASNPFVKALPFLLPAFIIYIMLILYPIGNAFVMSFFKWDGVSSHKEWVGIANYVDIFTRDPIFVRALSNTGLWVGCPSLFRPPGDSCWRSR